MLRSNIACNFFEQLLNKDYNQGQTHGSMRAIQEDLRVSSGPPLQLHRRLQARWTSIPSTTVWQMSEIKWYLQSLQLSTAGGRVQWNLMSLGQSPTGTWKPMVSSVLLLDHWKQLRQNSVFSSFRTAMKKAETQVSSVPLTEHCWGERPKCISSHPSNTTGGLNPKVTMNHPPNCCMSQRC